MATASINFSANADEEVVGGGGGIKSLDLVWIQINQPYNSENIMLYTSKRERLG